MLLLLAAVVAVAGLAKVAPVYAVVEALRGLAEGVGPARATLVLAAGYAAAELVLIPGSLIALLAGAILGPALGSVAVWVGACTSASVAFGVTRHLTGPQIAALAERAPRIGRLRRALSNHGWRWVAALRLFPVVPFAVQNYVAGLSGVGFGPYLAASAIAMIPGVILYSWAGHTGAEVALAAAGEDPLTPQEWGGLLIVAALTVWVGRLVRRRLVRRQRAV